MPTTLLILIWPFGLNDSKAGDSMRPYFQTVPSAFNQTLKPVTGPLALPAATAMTFVTVL
jgi:hypothetical protein